MTGDGGKWRILSLTAFVLVLFGAAGIIHVIVREPEEHVCEVDLPLFRRGPVTVRVQDWGEPGLGPCDGSEVHSYHHMLGIDCRLRDPTGAVVAVLEPNRPDGTCTQPEDGSPYPLSWTTP
jgi:hypothetical protein